MSEFPENEKSASESEVSNQRQAGELIETDDDLDLEVQVEGMPAGASGDAEVSAISEHEQKIKELEAKNKDTYDRLLRATADIDNLRKRSKRDLDDATYKAKSKTLLEILPVIDNLERALEHAQKSVTAVEGTKSVVDGVELVLRGFSQALERCGVAPISAKDQPFDPNLHEAVSQTPSEEHAAGTVVSVLQNGFKLGERLLRPSLVVVSSGPAAGASSPASDASEQGAGDA